jgi:hypothetical protein
MLTRIILTAALTLMCNSAYAEYILGSVGFTTYVSPGTGNLNQAMTFLNLQSTTSTSGFFAGFSPGTAWGNFTLNANSSISSVVSINDSSFGNFSGTVVTDTGEYSLGTAFAQGFTRYVTVQGQWTPGTQTAFAGVGARLAAITITLTRNAPLSGTDGTAISGGLTLQSFGNAAVPEPSSMIFAGLSAAIGAFTFIRRRIQQTTPSVISPPKSLD